MAGGCLSLRPSDPGARPFLESTVNCFESFQCVEQLQAGLTGLVRARHELLRMLDREPDPVDGKRPMNPSFVFGGTAGYWVHERNKQFEQSRGAQSILA